MEQKEPPAVIVPQSKWLDYVKLAVWVLILAAGVGTFVVQVVKGEKPTPPDLPPPPVFNVYLTGSPTAVSTQPVIAVERK